MTAAVTLFPGVGRDLATFPDRCARLALFLEPGHYTPSGVGEAPGVEKGVVMEGTNLRGLGAARQTGNPKPLLHIGIAR